MDIQKLKDSSDAVGRVARWMQLLQLGLNLIDADDEQLANCADQTIAAIAKSLREHTKGIDDTKTFLFRETLLRLVVVRAMDSSANQYGEAHGITCTIIQASIDSTSDYDSTIRAEQGSGDDLGTMADLVGKIARAESNGTALGYLAGFRKEVRQHVIDEMGIRRAEEIARVRDHYVFYFRKVENELRRMGGDPNKLYAPLGDARHVIGNYPNEAPEA